ncbi:hypothetical protein SAMN02799624_05249 [Paenibacillus sp. UNC496MF]|uniref:hypothetical protein n=1 Tax=Paenibacillus sp. UNC496MF TaxID=1502753 RepID=UPI0008F3F71D|nr:hypothetical protein [Paenibacillus sp. UNC496MF]SFJ62858.1 hypothetical protein SAMN02799624_05249 [Paenibacillus sp. UNC496MF]
MEINMYSVSADMDASDLHTAAMPYGQAKFMYDRWKADPEVFNVIMYRHEGDKKIMLGPSEV